MSKEILIEKKYDSYNLYLTESFSWSSINT